MAITSALLYRGNLGTGTNTLYLATANTVVTNIAIANSNATSVTATVNLSTGGTSFALLSAVTIPANSTVFFDLKQYIANTQTITGGASTTGVTVHISGVTGV